MKILITVGIYPPDIGGPASFVPKIANLFVDNEFEVTVICLSETKIQDNERYNVIRILRKQNLLIRWVKTIFTIIKNGFNANYIFVNGLPMESYIANLFLRKKLIRKIVGDWAWERGRNRGINYDSFDEFQINSHGLHLEIAKFSRGWTATKADLVITPSEHLSKVVQNWGVNPKNLRVIYNGTNLSNEIVKRKNEENKIKLITVGRLAPWKNIDSIIHAMSILKKSGIDLLLYIVGSGPLEKELKEQVIDLQMTDEIIFTGQKNKDELKEYYLNSDIYIQASGYEGLPHVLLEAINYDLNIISTPIGGSNEILKDGENGFVLELINGKKPDPKKLNEIVVQVIENNNLASKKKLNAKKCLQTNFDENKNFLQYLEIFT